MKAGGGQGKGTGRETVEETMLPGPGGQKWQSWIDTDVVSDQPGSGSEYATYVCVDLDMLLSLSASVSLSQRGHSDTHLWKGFMKIKVGQVTGLQSEFMKQILTQDVSAECPPCAKQGLHFSVSPQNNLACSSSLMKKLRGQMAILRFRRKGWGTFLRRILPFCESVHSHC